jgi:hypothetical protein
VFSNDECTGTDELSCEPAADACAARAAPPLLAIDADLPRVAATGVVEPVDVITAIVLA